jgi:signal transduction histidine kinase
MLELTWLQVSSHTILALLCVALCASFFLLYRRGYVGLSVVATWIPCFVAVSLQNLLLAFPHVASTTLTSVANALVAITATIGIVSMVVWAPRFRVLPTRRQMQETQEALERANAELEAFTASVSHDLRSPLTTIAGQAGLLEMAIGSKLDEDQRRRLQRIHASVRQMSELIEALLNLSRISQLPLVREEIDVTSAAERILQELRHRDPHRQVETRVAPGIKVHGDPRLIASVLENLLGNAWKFTSKCEQPQIEVDAVRNGAEYRICVRDNGCGFNMSHHDKLFQPFYRLHPHSEYPGSGIGLATAKRIVARHGGRIWAESQPGCGATFWFTVGPAQR